MDEATAASTDFGWVCFQCHSASDAGTNGAVVYCIRETLRSTLYCHAFYVTRSLESRGGSCNLEYRKQANGSASRLRHFPLAFDRSDADDDCSFQSPIQPRFPRHTSCSQCTSSEVTSPMLSSSSSLLSTLSNSSRTSTVMKSLDANHTGRLQHARRNYYTECDSILFNRHTTLISCSASSSCLCNRLHPNEITSPDISLVTDIHHCNYHNQQHLKVRRNEECRCDINNKRAVSYTRCKCK